MSQKMDYGFWSLSTGEQCYVALANIRSDLLSEIHYTVAEVISRLGDEWTSGLVTVMSW
jgi:hypothetical protein